MFNVWEIIGIEFVTSRVIMWGRWNMMWWKQVALLILKLDSFCVLLSYVITNVSLSAFSTVARSFMYSYFINWNEFAHSPLW